MNESLKIAWAAGLFEGEGSISLRGRSGIILALSMTDEDVVRRFADIFGGNVQDSWNNEVEG